MGLKMVLKALGINVSDEHIAQAEKLIPQLPELVNRIIKVFNESLQKADARITALETSNQHLIEQNRVIQGVEVSLLDEMKMVFEKLEEISNGIRDGRNIQHKSTRGNGTGSNSSVSSTSKRTTD